MTPTQAYWRGRSAVYRIYDADARLIYIGASRSVPQRLAQHRIETWWVPLLARVRVELHPDITAAFAAEKAAIAKELPAFNVKHTGRDAMDFRHWTLNDYRVAKAHQVATWTRMYLPQKPHEVGRSA